MTDPDEAAWRATLADLDRRHRSLLDVVAGLDAGRLDEIASGKPYPIAVVFHGTGRPGITPTTPGRSRCSRS